MDFTLLMNQYFGEEKTESLILGIIAVLLIVLSCYLFFGVKSSVAKGAATILVVTGLIGAVTGGTVYFRTDGQVRALTGLYETDRAEFLAQEVPRMKVVMKNFGIYKAAYLVSILAGLCLIFFLKKDYWQGFALGLLIFGTLGMIIDLIAEGRGQWYLKALLEQGP